MTSSFSTFAFFSERATWPWPVVAPSGKEALGDRDRRSGADDLRDVAHDEAGEVDGVGADVEERAGAGPVELVTPGVRQERIGGVVALVLDQDLHRVAELARGDAGGDVGDGGDAAVVEDRAGDPGGIAGEEPGVACLGGGEGERLLAEDVLACLERGAGNLGVEEVRQAD